MTSQYDSGSEGNPLSQVFSARSAPLLVVLLFIVGMVIYSQLGKLDAGPQFKRDLKTTYPRHFYEGYYEQVSRDGAAIITIYSNGQGRVRIEATMPNSTAITTTLLDFIDEKRYFLHEQQKTYIESHMSAQGMAGFDEEMFKCAGAQDLGQATVFGIKCHGYRTHLPADPNTPLESWFTDGGYLVLSKAGTTEIKISKIIKRQPKTQLFQIPPDYKKSSSLF